MKKLLVAGAVLLITSAMAEVKYKDFQSGDTLYTRGTDGKNTAGWIQRCKVIKVTNSTADCVCQRANITSVDFNKLNYGTQNTGDCNKVCVNGCYTDEESAIIDVKRMMTTNVK